MFIPRALRPHFAAIYAYCRGVDDIGDEFEGDRLKALDEWAHQLTLCYTGTPETPEFRALQHTIRQFDLPRQPFDDLIEANRRDQHQSTYDTWEDLLDYCRYSANPVGRMVLGLFGYQDEYRQTLSDCTCTALQIANHLQDISRDVVRGRYYVPIEDLERFGSSLAEYRTGVITEAIRACIRHEVERTWELFRRGPTWNRRCRSGCACSCDCIVMAERQCCARLSSKIMTRCRTDRLCRQGRRYVSLARHFLSRSQSRR